MKRFSFRLERLLEFHQQKQRHAEFRQKQIQMALDAVRKDIQHMETELAAAVPDLTPGTIPGGSYWGRYRFAADITEAIERAEQQARLVERELRRATRELTEAKAETEALLNVRGEAWTEYRRECERDTQRNLDETALRMWQREPRPRAAGNEGR